MRIYRLLAEARVRPAPTPALPPPGSLDALQAEVLELREKLARTEMREEAHQNHWAMEVDRLRQRVAVLEPHAQQAQSSQEIAQGLHLQLQAAVRRAVQFEEQLVALQHSTGQGSEVAPPARR